MEDNEQIEPKEDEDKDDEIDLALIGLVQDLAGASSDDDLDAAEDLLYDVLGDLVDDEKIEDVPDESAKEEEKQNWIQVYLPIVKDALTTAWNSEEE